MFLDGNRITPSTEKCVCTVECEFPCWQRLGMTTSACCKGCAPLPSFDDTATPGGTSPEAA